MWVRENYFYFGFVIRENQLKSVVTRSRAKNEKKIARWKIILLHILVVEWANKTDFCNYTQMIECCRLADYWRYFLHASFTHKCMELFFFYFYFLFTFTLVILLMRDGVCFFFCFFYCSVGAAHTRFSRYKAIELNFFLSTCIVWVFSSPPSVIVIRPTTHVSNATF